MKDKILKDLRKCYKDKDIKSLKRKYDLGKWWLSEEKRKEIEKAIHDLENNNKLIKDAVDNYGYKSIDKQTNIC